VIPLLSLLMLRRLVWGITPDVWSLSGSCLILGGAIWVSVVKSRIKHEHSEDIEFTQYTAVELEDTNLEDNIQFEVGDREADPLPVIAGEERLGDSAMKGLEADS
jgi:hypothetical protein